VSCLAPTFLCSCFGLCGPTRGQRQRSNVSLWETVDEEAGVALGNGGGSGVGRVSWVVG
jgi:hypothetical protein